MLFGNVCVVLLWIKKNKKKHHQQKKNNLIFQVNFMDLLLFCENVVQADENS